MGCGQSKERDAYATLPPTAEPPAPAAAQDPVRSVTAPKDPVQSVQKDPEPRNNLPEPVPPPAPAPVPIAPESDMGTRQSKNKAPKKEEASTQNRSAVSEPVQKTQPPPPPAATQEPKPKPPPPKPAESSSGSVPMQNSTTVPDVPQPDSSSGMAFEELYRLKGVLGTGAFSTVREGKHRRNPDMTYAVKCVNRAKLTDEDAAALLDEVAILREFNHPHIIRLYDFFEQPSTYYLVMERMCGGELFDRIVAKAYYNEKEARDTCKILLEAVGYCHANNVAHRDLKPENLLLLSEEDDSTVKIADFGFAKRVLVPRSLTTQCGTPGYVAPEILEGVPYDTMSDMWSVGVILYILLGGYPPFIENNQRELFRKIRRGDYEFHEEYWGTVSEDAKNLISALLTVDPKNRLTAADALKNTWILGDDEELAHKDLGVNLEEFKKFNAKRKFKAAVSTVMAVNKLQSLGKDFLKNLD